MIKIKNRFKTVFAALLLLCFLQQSRAQVAGAPYIPTDKRPFSFLYGGSSAETNHSNAVPTSDGGYIFLGYTSSAVSGDITEANKGVNDTWIVKVDAIGKITWQRRLGGSSTESDGFIQQTADGGYIAAVTTASSANGDITGTNKGSTDIWIIKLTATGAISWQQLYGGSRAETAVAIRQTTDNGYILLASSASSANGNVTGTNNGSTTASTDLWIVKLTASGAISWQRLYGGTLYETGSDIKQTSDGGYIVLAYIQSSVTGNVTGTNKGALDAWILKLNASGAITWQQLYGGNSSETMQCITQTSDGGYIMSGNTSSSANGNVSGTNKGSNDIWIVKMNANGAISWQQLYGGSGLETCQMVLQTSDGGYIVGGTSASSANGNVTGTNNGGNDAWVLKLTATGVISWQKLYGGSGSDSLWSMAIAPGGYIIQGTSASNATGDILDNSNGSTDHWLMKIDTSGNIIQVPDVGQ